jgi:hypothetical protein
MGESVVRACRLLRTAQKKQGEPTIGHIDYESAARELERSFESMVEQNLSASYVELRERALVFRHVAMTSLTKEESKETCLAIGGRVWLEDKLLHATLRKQS